MRGQQAKWELQTLSCGEAVIFPTYAEWIKLPTSPRRGRTMLKLDQQTSAEQNPHHRHSEAGSIGMAAGNGHTALARSILADSTLRQHVEVYQTTCHLCRCVVC